MIPSGRLAFANARVRARKSTLLGPESVRRLLAGARQRDRVRRDDRDADDVRAAASRGFAELVAWYRVILSDYPWARALCLALLRRHEESNIMLVWRAVARGHRYDRWARLWQPLGPLEEVSVDACRECRTLPALVDVLRSTPYGEVAAAMLRAHADDLLAVELGLDRWTTRAIAHAADALDDREAAARSLALAIVTERDLEWLRRGPRAFGLSSDAVAGSLVSLPRDCPHEALRALAAWTADEGPIRRVLPRRLARLAPSVADWDGLLLAARRARRAACRRAFAGQPFCLAPALALLLFKEEELRTIDAIAEAGGTGSTIALEAAIAASAMGG